MYNPAAHEQAINHNRRLMPDARVFGVLAATGALALGGGVGHANAAGESAAQPRSIDTALEQPMTQISTDIAQVGPEEKTKILSVSGVVRRVQNQAQEDEIKKVTIKKKGGTLNFGLTQQDRMAEVQIGSVFTERVIPGFDGVDDAVVPTYSKVYSYLISPDFVNNNTVRVQAVAKAPKGKWRGLSKTITMPKFNNYDIVPIPNPQLFNESDPVLIDKSVNGYKGNIREGYLKNHRSEGKIKLRSPLKAKDRGNVYLKVTQRYAPTPEGKKNGAASNVRGTKTTVYGPFKGAKQSKSKPVYTGTSAK